MKLTCDPKHNIAYIRLCEKSSSVETIKLSDAVHIDITTDGTRVRD